MQDCKLILIVKNSVQENERKIYIYKKMFASLLVMPHRIPHQKVEFCACDTCLTILKRHVSLRLGGLRFIWVLFLDGPVSSISNALCSIFRVLPTWPSLHPPSSPGYLKSHHRRALLLPPHLLILNSETEKNKQI